MSDVLFLKIQRLKDETLYLKGNKDRFLTTIRSSTDTRKIVERSVFLAAEAVLDISDLILVNKGCPRPATYREAIYKLGEYKIVPPDFAYRFTYIAGSGIF